MTGHLEPVVMAEPPNRLDLLDRRLKAGEFFSRLFEVEAVDRVRDLFELR